MSGGRIVYEDQATVFETRAGIPDDAAARVAALVHAWGGIDDSDLLLEIGAGTGVIGRWLATLPGRYLGLDSSPAMLQVFRPRLPTDGSAVLVVADADRPWPVPTGAVRVVFGSRVLHLLDPPHALAEAMRVAHPEGALLLSGRVAHDRSSPRSLARAQLRELLRRRGLRPSPTGGRPDRLFQLAEQAGATPLPGRVVAVWPETVSVSRVIDWWRGKTSLGGINPDPRVAEEILAELTGWAARTYDDPTSPVTTRTRYLLEGVRIRPRPSAAPTGKEML